METPSAVVMVLVGIIVEAVADSGSKSESRLARRPASGLGAYERIRRLSGRLLAQHGVAWDDGILDVCETRIGDAFSCRPSGSFPPQSRETRSRCFSVHILADADSTNAFCCRPRPSQHPADQSSIYTTVLQLT